MKTFNEIILAQELIRFPTIKTEDKGIMKFLSKKLSSIGFRCKIIKSKGESFFGQIIPLSSLEASIIAAGILEIPIP